jgi:murein L,D-transpeptidase YafK
MSRKWSVPAIALAWLPALLGSLAMSADRAAADMASLPEIIPTSDRSEAAWQRRAPFLEQELASAGLNLGAPIFIRVFKASRELELWMESDDGFKLFRSYRICEMSGELGPKLAEGDHQAPEGFYSVDASWLNPDSAFHLSFNIGFPNEFDRAHGRTGSLIMVHGGCASAGCFAMTDWRMEEIYILAEAALRSSQQRFDVHIFPFRMSEEKLSARRDSRWYDFWRNLQQGHDHFVEHSRPPQVSVVDGRYEFQAAEQEGALVLATSSGTDST